LTFSVLLRGGSAQPLERFSQIGLIHCKIEEVTLAKLVLGFRVTSLGICPVSRHEFVVNVRLL
jgi:hypothetical protein